MAETLRAFIAIELPTEVTQHLGNLIQHLRGRGPSGVRWVRPEAIHLTLKFLGSIDVGRVTPILEALERSVQGQLSFRLHLEGAGAFPRLQAPRVLWVGLSGDVETLHRLQQGVEESLAALDFPPEKRPFSPHLTLGRVQRPLSPHDRELLPAILGRLPVNEALAIPSERVSLMQSTLLPSGAIYRRIGEIQLQKLLSH